MTMDLGVGEAVFLLIATALAGAMNAVAGGGSFVVFPALIFAGLSPIAANATCTVALWPGSIASAGAYRRELSTERGWLIGLSLLSFIGGLAGAVLLLKTPETTFAQLVPWLLLFATLVFAFGNQLSRGIRRRLGFHGEGAREWRPGVATVGAVALLQLGISAYGGYFGGGIGILMLAMLSAAGFENIHAMNALKTLLAACINGVATATFLWQGAVVWPHGALLIVAGVLGGYFGAQYARRARPERVRLFILTVAWSMTIYFFLPTTWLPTFLSR